jgi:predicted GNAT family acetyltransferase
MTGDHDLRVTDNPAKGRYEVHVDGKTAGFVAYRSEPGTVVLVHTQVDPAFEGRGLAARLVAGALDDIRSRGLSVVPVCPFVRSYLRRHPEYAELVVGDGTAGRPG